RATPRRSPPSLSVDPAPKRLTPAAGVSTPRDARGHQSTGGSSVGAKQQVLLDGLGFGEGPRWHGGEFWFSGIHARQVHRRARDESGPQLAVKSDTVVAEFDDDSPSGLGWLPDGSL